MIRNDNNPPVDPYDGILVFEGTANTLVDSTVSAGNFYNYAIFSVDSAGNFSNPAHVSIDTLKYCITGSININDSTGLNNVELSLRTPEGKLVDKTQSDSNGHFAFINLNTGSYVLEATHKSASITNPTREIEINTDNQIVNFSAHLEPTLFLMNNSIDVSPKHYLFIKWAYRNIPDNALVDIELNRGDGWESLAQNIPVLEGRMRWLVNKPLTDDATIRLTLTDNPNVMAEYKFAIRSVADFNRDGAVDILDLQKFIKNFGIVNSSIWPYGDFTKDKDVDGLDLVTFINELD